MRRCELGAVAGAPSTAVPASPPSLPEKIQCCAVSARLSLRRAQSRLLGPPACPRGLVDGASAGPWMEKGFLPSAGMQLDNAGTTAAVPPLSTAPGVSTPPGVSTADSAGSAQRPCHAGRSGPSRSFSDHCCFPIGRPVALCALQGGGVFLTVSPRLPAQRAQNSAPATAAAPAGGPGRGSQHSPRCTRKGTDCLLNAVAPLRGNT